MPMAVRCPQPTTHLDSAGAGEKERIEEREEANRKSPLGHRALRATGLQAWPYRAIRRHMAKMAYRWLGISKVRRRWRERKD